MNAHYFSDFNINLADESPYLLAFKKLLDDTKVRPNHHSSESLSVFGFLNLYFDMISAYLKWPDARDTTKNSLNEDQMRFFIKIALSNSRWYKLAQSLFRAEKILNINLEERHEMVERVLKSGGIELAKKLIDCEGRNLIFEYFQYELNKRNDADKVFFIVDMIKINTLATTEMFRAQVNGMNAIKWFMLYQGMNTTDRLIILIDSFIPVDKISQEINKMEHKRSLLNVLKTLPSSAVKRIKRHTELYNCFFSNPLAIEQKNRAFEAMQYPFTKFFNTTGSAIKFYSCLKQDRKRNIHAMNIPRQNEAEQEEQSKKTKSNLECEKGNLSYDLVEQFLIGEVPSTSTFSNDLNQDDKAVEPYGEIAEFLIKPQNSAVNNQPQNNCDDDYLEFENNFLRM